MTVDTCNVCKMSLPKPIEMPGAVHGFAICPDCVDAMPVAEYTPEQIEEIRSGT